MRRSHYTTPRNLHDCQFEVGYAQELEHSDTWVRPNWFMLGMALGVFLGYLIGRG